MSDLPDEVRERAALDAFNTFSLVSRSIGGIKLWHQVVDAVAEVLNGDRPDRAYLRAREEMCRILHDANTGKIGPDPDDPADYPAMAKAVLAHYEKPLLKLAKQRKRRKEAEANYRHVREQLHDRTVELETRTDERYALAARIEKLRTALGQIWNNGCDEGVPWVSKKTCLATGAVPCGPCVSHAALATDNHVGGVL